MTSPLHLGVAARQDIASAQSWYADQDVPGLDLRFRDELAHAFRQISAFPEGFPVVHRDVRRVNLRRFPYAVFYHFRGDVPFVLGVIHHARHPRVLEQRR